jgi:two-component system, cell cycle sensor histidine kinase and response regulator CckA
VNVESSPGAGTVMSVILPFAYDAVAVDSTKAAILRGNGERILVVEDEPVVRSLTRRMLESAGYVVFQAPNGAAALEFLATQSNDIDLVLSDVVMPNVNGHQLAQRVSELYPELPVLLMSGYGGDDIAQRGLMISGIALVQKPFTMESLTRSVRTRLDAH